MVGPPVYPPASGTSSYTPSASYPPIRRNFQGGFGEYHNQQWSLPPAMIDTGALLVLPPDPGLWDDVISRWETITINRLNERIWTTNKEKLFFVENLFEEHEKRMWQQWRTTYPDSYAALEAISDDPQNITSQVRQIILMEDPYRGSTEEQDRAYRALERLTCDNTRDIWRFMTEFRILASKSGRLFFPDMTDKFFTKLPPVLSKKIEEVFKAKYPGLSVAVLPAIKFTHSYQFVERMVWSYLLQK